MRDTYNHSLSLFVVRCMPKIIILLAIILVLSGCATSATWDTARGVKPFTSEPIEPKPAYYALLPLTVPLDVVTFPVQCVVIGASFEGFR